MAENSGGKGKGALIGCFVTVLVLLILVCCCGFLGLVFAPGVLGGALVKLIVEDQPLPAAAVVADPARAAAIGDRVCSELGTSGTTRLTGDDLNQLIWADITPPAEGEPKLEVLSLQTPGDALVMDLSLNTDPTTNQYVNFHGKTRFRLEQGRFTSFYLDELKVGSFWDMMAQSPAASLTSMHNEINRNLDTQRLQNPELAQMLDALQLLTVEGDALVVQLTPGQAQTMSMCEGRATVVPPPAPAEGAPAEGGAEGADDTAVDEAVPAEPDDGATRTPRDGPRRPGRRPR